ncbi:hypothetical protein L345_13669, partial [Ophiophagus hannah]
MDSRPPWHLILVAHIFLASNPQGIPAHVLVDSGATTNFMDMAFAVQYTVSPCPVESPMLMETIDGWVLLSGPIKATTQPLHLTIRSHEEAIQFYITSGLHFPVVLDLSTSDTQWLLNRFYYSQSKFLQSERKERKKEMKEENERKKERNSNFTVLNILELIIYKPEYK